jgi:hypothetical protein
MSPLAHLLIFRKAMPFLHPSPHGEGWRSRVREGACKAPFRALPSPCPLPQGEGVALPVQGLVNSCPPKHPQGVGRICKAAEAATATHGAAAPLGTALREAA